MNKRVLYILYANPASYPPLEHSARILLETGWAVYFLGVAVPGQESIVFPKLSGLRISVLNTCQPGWRQKLQYIKFLLYAFYIVVRFNCKWIYASDLLSTPTALVLKRLLRLKSIYHEHDSPGNFSDSIFIRICMHFRKLLASDADIIVLPNRVRGKLFALDNNISEDKVSCVWNCPARSEATEIEIEPQHDDFWIIYHGSINPGRLPLSIVQALAMLPDQIKLRVIGYETIGSFGYLEKMKNTAKQLGVLHRIELLGVYPREKVLYWCRRSDIGLSFMPINSDDINMANMTGASNKPFDNLAAGIPLLVSDLQEWQTMFVSNGFALSCNPDDPQSIASAVLWFFDHPKETHDMRESGRKRIIDEWNYERQFEPVLKLMTDGNKEAH